MKTVSFLFIITSFIIGVFGDEVKSVSVIEGDSVTLHTNLTDIKKAHLILWKFANEQDFIAKFNIEANKPDLSTDDERFRDRLQLDNQTGDLIITNIRTQHTGLYHLEIITTSNPIQQSFMVTVSDGVTSVSVIEGHSVTLNTDTELQRDDLIQCMFDESLIAEIYKPNNIFTTYNGANERFRDKLKLNYQTGDLTITNITTQHAGLYQMKISSRIRSIHRNITVSVNNLFLYVAEKYATYILVIAAAVVAVVAAVVVVVVVLYHYRHRFLIPKKLWVLKGDSVTLLAGVTELQEDDDVIEWSFGSFCFKKLLIHSNKPCDDKRFRNKLKLDTKTGNLTIKNIKTEHSGHYQVKISSGGKTSYKRYRVSVTDSIRRNVLVRLFKLRGQQDAFPL